MIFYAYQVNTVLTFLTLFHQPSQPALALADLILERSGHLKSTS